MATVSRENIGLLNDKITVKLSKEDYLPNFEKKLKEYSKTASIPGFRKGMVPSGMIKKMYGPSIYTDEVLKTMEKQLYSYLDAEKPDIFAQPLPLEMEKRKLDLNNPSDYEFDFEIGLKPQFELAALDKAPLTFHKVKITDEMVQQDLERMLQTRGKLVEIEKIDSEEDELTLAIMEANEEGKEKGEGIKNVISRRLGDLTPEAQEQLKGKGKDDSIILQLSQCFDGERLASVLLDLGLDKDDEAAAAKFFTIKVVKVDAMEKRALDEGFFNEVFPGAGITTEEAFRVKLGEEIQQYWNGQSRNQLQDQLYHYLLDETQVEFPAQFLNVG
jgi:trigger factor